MTEPTDADRDKAEEIVRDEWLNAVDTHAAITFGSREVIHAVMDHMADTLTAALAEARTPGEKLRDDVLALADEMDDELAAQGILLDRCIRPGDRLRALVKGQR